jgi:uncharacterized paraquat-inducible protein A
MASADPTQQPLGRRERKKAATRKNISDVATMMFLERGFDNVSIREVADAAEEQRAKWTDQEARRVCRKCGEQRRSRVTRREEQRREERRENRVQVEVVPLENGAQR